MSVGLGQAFASSNWNTTYKQSVNTCVEFLEGPRVLTLEYTATVLTLSYNNTSIGSSNGSNSTVDGVVQFI